MYFLTINNCGIIKIIRINPKSNAKLFGEYTSMYFPTNKNVRVNGNSDNNVSVDKAVALLLELINLFIITDFALPKVVELEILSTINTLPNKTPTKGAKINELKRAQIDISSNF